MEKDEGFPAKSRARADAPKNVCVSGQSIREVMHCPKAWVSLSVGNYEDAYALSTEHNDLLCSAAVFVMRGEVSNAVKSIEAFVIAGGIVMSERMKEMHQNDYASLKRLGTIVVCYATRGSISLKDIEGNLDLTPEEIQAAAVEACDIVDWDLVHRWFIIALFLHEGGYVTPRVAWFHSFFALSSGGRADAKSPASTKKQGSEAKATGRKASICNSNTCEALDATRLTDILLTHCSQNEILFITIVCAWRTRRYRTVITKAREFLLMEDGGVVFDDNARVMVRFMFIMSLVEIGERTLASKEVVTLMRHTDRYVAMVGNSIAAYLVPIPEVVDHILLFDGTASQKRYLLSLCEYVHALTFVQLGLMESAIEIIEEAIKFCNSTIVGEWMLDLIVVACTAMEDSETIRKYPLSPLRQLYIALSPAFFGGFTSQGVKVSTKSPVARLLNEKQIPICGSIKQMLPLYTDLAYRKFAKNEYVEAWVYIVYAVGCAEEIIGSVEFAFTECAPPLVYALGCRIGERAMGTLMDVMTSGGKAAFGSDRFLIGGDGDALGEMIIRLCAEWVDRIRGFYPYLRLGALSMSKYATFCHVDGFLDRALNVAQRYPRSALAQNCLTLALYANHHIPEAADSASNAMEAFPHAVEVKSLYSYILRKDGLYYFNYRGLIPIRCFPGTEYILTKRVMVTHLLLFANLLIYLGTLFLNLPQLFTFSEDVKEIAVRVQLPSLLSLAYPAVVFTYAIAASLLKRSLTHTILQDLFFENNPWNRFVFAMRGMALVNATNALQITLLGNNFLFTSHFYTFLFYLFFLIAFVPFTSHLWLLPSYDEPMEEWGTWLALYSIDVVSTAFLLVPHVILFAFEPLMFVIYLFFKPVQRPSEKNISGQIRKRLLTHQECCRSVPWRYELSSGSGFLHVQLIKLLFYKSYSSLPTKHVVGSQLDEENYRMFPLVEIAQKIPVQPIRLCDEVLKSLSVRSASNDKDKLGSDRVCQNRYQDSNRDRNRDNEDDEYSLFFSSDDDSQCGAASDADRGDAMSLADLFQAENALNYFFDTTTSMCNAFRTKGRRKSKIESTLVAPVSPTLTASPLKRKESVIGFRPRSAMSDAASKGEMLPLGRRRSMYRSTRDLRQRMSRRASFVLSVKDDGQPNAEVFSDDVTERRSTPNYNSSRKASFARAASACRFGNSSRASKGAVSSATGKARKPSFDGTAGDRVWPTSTACFIDEESDNNTNSPKSGVAMNSSVDPSKELMLTEALQGLCQIYRSNAAADASARGTADLEAAKAKVLNCLLTITSETNTGHISLKSEECCGAVCDAVFLLVTGDGPLNRSQESKEPLEESILQHVELSCIAKQLMDKDFLLQCIFHDNGKAFDLAMKSVCVNHMLADNWKRLFNAICSSQCDKIVYLQSAIQGIKCITDKKLSQDVCSMFHGAVKSVLITESLSTHLNEALTLLETVKNQNCFSSGFWDAEGPDGQTLFSAACAAGKLDIVKKLWSLGVVDSLNKVQSNGTNGLMQAVINNQKSVVQWFCQQPANTTGESFRHVHAVYGSVLDVAKEVDGALYTMLEAHVGTLGGS